MAIDYTQAVLGIASGGVSTIFNSKDKKKKPALPPLDIDQIQRDAIKANLGILPNAQEVGRGVNTFNMDELNRMYENALPGYDKIKTQVGNNLLSMNRGEIPTDVSDAVLKNAAGRAFSGGFAGTGMSRNLTSRDLGLTSLDIMGKGQDSTERWLQASKNAPQFDVTSMFISPLDRLSFKASERNLKFDRDWASFQIDQMGSKDEQMLRGMISNY